MSSHPRKRRRGAVDSGQAQKRSRLLPSSASGTLQTELIDLEERAEEEVIDLTGESSEPEVITLSDDESAVDREQSQQYPNVSRAAENSAKPLTSGNEEEPRDIDGERPADPANALTSETDNSEVHDGEQSQQYPLGSRAAENEAELLASQNKGEARDIDRRPSRNFLCLNCMDCFSQDWEQSQQYPLGSRSAENEAELLASQNEEELRDVDGPSLSFTCGICTNCSQYCEQNQQYAGGSRATENSPEILASNLLQEPRDIEFEWPAGPANPLTLETDVSQDWEQSQQYPLGSRAAENEAELLASQNEEEPRYIDGPCAIIHCVICMYCYSQLIEAYEQSRRNVTLSSQEQLDGSALVTGADDVRVAAPAPAEQGPAEEETATSDAQAGVLIRCPICMDFYPEIVQSGRLIVATLCGHIFCSQCLPTALETTGMCPSCRMELTPELYIPIYI